VFFSQEHWPGERVQTDFTSANEVAITFSGEVLQHVLCHVVLPCSNWQWATAFRSESMAALRRGTQAAFSTLGFVPKFHQTDNSTAATHSLRAGKRDFNGDDRALMGHLSMDPVTTGVGEKDQNGVAEGFCLAPLGATPRRRRTLCLRALLPCHLTLLWRGFPTSKLSTQQRGTRYNRCAA
jgi:hypothetical protein